MNALGLLHLPFLARELRPVAGDRVAGGPRRSVLLGAIFAMGWTPCIGPILATVLTKAAADSSLTQGMLLLLYSAGLGIPFIGLALWFDGSARVRRWLTGHTMIIQRLGGVAMIAIGLGYLTGIWSTVFTGARVQAEAFADLVVDELWSDENSRVAELAWVGRRARLQMSQAVASLVVHEVGLQLRERAALPGGHGLDDLVDQLRVGVVRGRASGT